MQLSSHKTDSDHGGKCHVGSERNRFDTPPFSIIGSRHGVCLMVHGEDGRTYRICLGQHDLRRIQEEAAKVSFAA